MMVIFNITSIMPCSHAEMNRLYLSCLMANFTWLFCIRIPMHVNSLYSFGSIKILSAFSLLIYHLLSINSSVNINDTLLIEMFSWPSFAAMPERNQGYCCLSRTSWHIERLWTWWFWGTWRCGFVLAVFSPPPAISLAGSLSDA